ncbi:MAG: enoyl-CoA hydratase/isomerase family protein [Actinobacteria bacterium]|nr:enoyl-CoA hydratase/isomerase family protein [Actinomycetota bacterium]
MTDLAPELTSILRRIGDLPDIEGLSLRLGKPREDQIEREATSPAAGGLIEESILALRSVPVPTVAAIDGHTSGYELALALACDIRLASTRATLDFSSAPGGVAPDLGWTYFLPRIVAPSRALEMLLEERRMSPGEARSEGVIAAVATADSLADLAREHALSLAAGRSREDFAVILMDMRSAASPT